MRKLADFLILRKSIAGKPLCLRIPIEEARFTVLDTETTGLDRKNDSIISIGALKMHGSRIELESIFYEEAKPLTQMKHESIRIHQITPSEVTKKPTIDAVIGDFLDFCSDDVLIGHFVTIDLGFINKEVKRIYGTTLKNPFIDTRRMYEWIKKNTGDFSRIYSDVSEEQDLFTLARQFQVPINGAHNALNDAFITAQLFQKFLSILKNAGLKTLKDLLRIGKP